MSRVRELVRLTAHIKEQARDLLVARDVSSRSTESNAAPSLDRLLKGRRMLYDEVRLAAWNLMTQPGIPASLR